MRRIFKSATIIILLLPVLSIHARPLSEKAEVFLVTCEPGKEVYSVFGHSAIWISDPVSSIDFVYNYGLFDFNTPNFYSKFVKGKLLYHLGRTTYQGFIRDYIAEGRSVYIQKIYFTDKETDDLYKILEINNLPENRDYLYDFFYDNCSSKIIDQFDAVLTDKTSIQHLDRSTGISFRKALEPYMRNNRWVYLGMDIGLGLPSDKIMTVRESMFLPLNLMNRLNDGLPPNLSGEPVCVFEGQPVIYKDTIWTPSAVLWIISVLFFLISIFSKTSSFTKIFDALLFTLTGLISLLILFLWFGSDHQSTHNNLNILWAFPLNLFFMARKTKWFKSWYDQYLKYYGLLQVILLVTWAWLPQDLNAALIPVVLLLAYRSLQISGWLPGLFHSLHPGTKANVQRR